MVLETYLMASGNLQTAEIRFRLNLHAPAAVQVARGIHDVSELPPGGQRFADILQAWVQQGQVLPQGLRQAALDLCVQLQRGSTPGRGGTSRRAGGELRYKLAVHVILAGDRAMAEQVVAVSCGCLLDCALVSPRVFKLAVHGLPAGFGPWRSQL